MPTGIGFIFVCCLSRFLALPRGRSSPYHCVLVGSIRRADGFLSAYALHIGIGFITPLVTWFSVWGLITGAVGGVVGSGILCLVCPPA